jgi:hypothetical protein
MLAVTNPHAITDGTNTTKNDYQLGFQLGYKDQYVNVVYGADGSGVNDMLYLDYTGGFDVSEDFYVGINTAYAHSSDSDSGYKGAALYLEKSFKKDFALGIRPEFFSKEQGNINNDQWAFTLTARKKLMENLDIITELRHDTSDDITFIANEDKVTGLTFAAVYSFD